MARFPQCSNTPSLHHSLTPSLRDSQYLQMFEFGVAEEGDLQSAFALGVAQMNLGPEPLAQFVLQAGDVGIPDQRRTGPGLRAVPASRACKRATSASVWRTLSPSLRMRSAASFWCFSLARPRITLAWPTDRRPSRMLAWIGGRQLEQAQRVGHDRAALAHFGRHFLLLELELLDELRVALGLFNRVKVLPLQVLDQRQFEHGAVVGLPQDDGDFRQARAVGRPASGVRPRSVPGGRRAHAR